MSQESKSIVDSMLDAQKKVVDSVVENTKKITGSNTIVNDTVQKGSEWYKNWLENQKNIFTQSSEKASATTETAKENVSKMNDYYQHWMDNQMNTARQMWEMNTNWVKNATENATNTAGTNPANFFNNGMNQWNSWMNNMNTANNWNQTMSNFFTQFQNANPFNMDAFKKANESSTSFFNQYNEIMTNTFAELQKNMKSNNIQDAYRNMVNVTEGFSKFYELWTPMFKSIQDKTFNMDGYKQWANPGVYKELMDKYFGFVPDNVRHHLQNVSDVMNNNFKHMGRDGMSQYNQMRNMMSSMPGMGSNEIFGNLLNSYNTHDRYDERCCSATY